MWFVNKTKYLALKEQFAQCESEKLQLSEQLEACQQEVERIEAERLSNITDHTEKNTINSLWGGTSQKLTDIREQSASFANSLADERKNLVDAGSLFAQATMSLASLSQSLGEIRNDSIASQKRIESVNKVTKEIGGFVGLIKGIADQTNLLALNAAIEAARAGEQGRGFAVVADEVRDLANRTGESTSQISELMADISEQADKATDGIRATTVKAESMTTNTELLLQTVNEVLNISDSMKVVISRASYSTFITTVMMDHIVWKNDVYKRLIADGINATDDITDHHQCRLGRWYFEGNGKKLFSNLPSFQPLDKPHEQVHKNGLDALNLYAAGDRHGAIEALQRMESASIEVQSLLEEMIEDLLESVNDIQVVSQQTAGEIEVF